MTKRYCRACKNLLPKSRYFNCIKCVPVLASDGDTIYETPEFDEHLVAMVEDRDLLLREPIPTPEELMLAEDEELVGAGDYPTEEYS